jgi:hypothetical protein
MILLTFNLIEVFTIIILAIICLGLVALALILYRLFISLLLNTEAHKKEGLNGFNIRITAPYHAAIDRILLELKYELNVADVFIGRFHNGGNFANGTKMEKFSITYGKASPNIKVLQPRFYDIFCSHWPVVMDYLITFDNYVCNDFKDCADANFVKDMQEAGFQSIYFYLICQNDAARTPEGFLGVCFSDSRFLEEEVKDRIKGDIPRLLSLMNLIPFKKKEKLI